MLMYTEFLKKNSTNILEFLQELGKNSKVYSNNCEGGIPLLEDMLTYVYATEKEMAVVLIEPTFSQHKTEIKTLAWGMAVSCEMIRNIMLSQSRHIPSVFGVLLTGDEVTVSSDVLSKWDFANISVIGGVDNLENLVLPVNPDEKLPTAPFLSSILQAGYTGSDIEVANDHLSELEVSRQSQETIGTQMIFNLENSDHEAN